MDQSDILWVMCQYLKVWYEYFLLFIQKFQAPMLAHREIEFIYDF